MRDPDLRYTGQVSGEKSDLFVEKKSKKKIKNKISLSEKFFYYNFDIWFCINKFYRIE